MEREGGPRGTTIPAGPWPVQLRYKSGLTGEQYVKRRAWRDATLKRCPNHPRGGCSFARHGTYPRKRPRGARVARWYCPESHMTFSRLPDCLAARLGGTLQAIEDAVAAAEAAPSLAKAADALRCDAVHLPGAMRWLGRRVRAVHRNLAAVRGLWPERFLKCPPEVGAFRERLKTEAVLVGLRGRCEGQLAQLAPPLGFCPDARAPPQRAAPPGCAAKPPVHGGPAPTSRRPPRPDGRTPPARAAARNRPRMPWRGCLGNRAASWVLFFPPQRAFDAAPVHRQAEAIADQFHQRLSAQRRRLGPGRAHRGEDFLAKLVPLARAGLLRQ